MTKVLTALYDHYNEAASAVAALEAAGIASSDISVIANQRGTDTAKVKEGNEAGPGAAGGATFGAVVGGATGLMAGLGMLAIPGVGPVVAAGWLVATLAGAAGGAAIGGAGGGLIGAMIGNGVPEQHAHVYAEGIRRGGTLVTVRAPGELALHAEAILAEYHRVDPTIRGESYRNAGWSGFDENAPADVRSDR